MIFTVSPTKCQLVYKNKDASSMCAVNLIARNGFLQELIGQKSVLTNCFYNNSATRDGNTLFKDID